jgi:symplekin
MIDATMNCLSILIRTRQAVANKIISAILNFNPLKQANTPMTPRTMVIVKSMERTTRALLRNVNKHNPNGPLAAKIDSYLQRLHQSRAAVFSETPSLKRPAPTEPTRLDDAKRQKLAGGTKRFPPMPPPPNSFAHLFTLTEDPTLQAFDVKLLPVDMVNTIAAVLLQHIDSNSLSEAIGAVKARYAHLQKVNMPTPIPEVPMAGPTGIDDEDDYDPEYDPGMEVIIAPVAQEVLQEPAQPAIELGPFELPKPPPLTQAEVTLISHQTVNRVFEVVTSFESQAVHRQKLGLNRLAASSNDRDAWVTMMTRLATRAPAGLNKAIGSDDDDVDGVQAMMKAESDDTDADKPTLANSIRQTLYMYILEDFRPRLNVAISWLNEEWYADKIQTKPGDKFKSQPNYYRWTLRLLDHILPYLDARDKNILIRFVSEIPAIDEQILERVKSLARDPERVAMSIMALQYLLMMRPPVRAMVLDTVESLWRDPDFKEAKASAAKVLGRWRPEVLREESNENGVMKKDETMKEEKEREEKLVEAKAWMNGLGGKSASKVDVERADPRKSLMVGGGTG